MNEKTDRDRGNAKTRRDTNGPKFAPMDAYKELGQVPDNGAAKKEADRATQFYSQEARDAAGWREANAADHSRSRKKRDTREGEGKGRDGK